MKITVEHYNETVSIEIDKEDIKLTEYMDMFERISYSIYGEKLINDWFELETKWRPQSKTKK